MSEIHAVRTLKEKRSELSVELAKLDLDRRRLIRQIHSMDEALSLFGHPSGDAVVPSGVKRRWLFKRGQLQRLVCDALRRLGDDAATAELTAHVMQRMGWDQSDKVLRGMIVQRVGDVRRRLAKRGGLTPPAANSLSSHG